MPSDSNRKGPQNGFKLVSRAMQLWKNLLNYLSIQSGARTPAVPRKLFVASDERDHFLGGSVAKLRTSRLKRSEEKHNLIVDDRQLVRSQRICRTQNFAVQFGFGR